MSLVIIRAMLDLNLNAGIGALGGLHSTKQLVTYTLVFGAFTQDPATLLSVLSCSRMEQKLLKIGGHSLNIWTKRLNSKISKILNSVEICVNIYSMIGTIQTTCRSVKSWRLCNVVTIFLI
jgi:hypothetical protein